MKTCVWMKKVFKTSYKNDQAAIAKVIHVVGLLDISQPLVKVGELSCCQLLLTLFNDKKNEFLLEKLTSIRGVDLEPKPAVNDQR